VNMNRRPLSYSVDFLAVSRSFTVPGEEYIPLQAGVSGSRNKRISVVKGGYQETDANRSRCGLADTAARYPPLSIGRSPADTDTVSLCSWLLRANDRGYQDSQSVLSVGVNAQAAHGVDLHSWLSKLDLQRATSPRE
jgi:hypothetical protein